MLNAGRMLSNDLFSEFDRDVSVSDFFSIPATLILPYTFEGNDGREVTLDIGQAILLNADLSIAKVGKDHIAVKRGDYVLNHLN